MEYPGHLVRIGEPDEQIVRAVKEQLNTVLPGDVELDPTNPRFGSETEAAVALFQARNSDAAGRPLTQDGEIGSLTWAQLFNRPAPVVEVLSGSFLQSVIIHAMMSVGVREQPRNSNRGPQVDVFLQRAGVMPGYAWCCAFMYWCFDEAAHERKVVNPMVKTAGCLDHWNRCRTAGARRIDANKAVQNPSIVTPGMMFVISHGGGLGHTGIIESVEGGLLRTIEGNTDASRTREGGGVYRLTRKVGEINLGYILYP